MVEFQVSSDRENLCYIEEGNYNMLIRPSRIARVFVLSKNSTSYRFFINGNLTTLEPTKGVIYSRYGCS